MQDSAFIQFYLLMDAGFNLQSATSSSPSSILPIHIICSLSHGIKRSFKSCQNQNKQQQITTVAYHPEKSTILLRFNAHSSNFLRTERATLQKFVISPRSNTRCLEGLYSPEVLTAVLGRADLKSPLTPRYGYCWAGPWPTALDQPFQKRYASVEYDISRTMRFRGSVRVP